MIAVGFTSMFAALPSFLALPMPFQTLAIAVGMLQ